MDQRRDRSGTSHGVRQPNVERDLRALSSAAEEHEETDRRHQRAADAEIERSGVDADEIQYADVGEQHKHRDHKTEVADAVDDERLLAGVGVYLVAEPESDQKVGTEADSFPADEENGVVRSKHEHQHEEHEQIQVGEVSRIPWIVAHVADAEDMDQSTDSSDDQNHHHRQLIELDRGIDLQVADRHPAEIPLNERRFRIRGHHRLPDRYRETEGQDDDSRTDGSRQRNLFRGPLAFGEVKRRIHVRANVLGTAVIVRRIPIAGRRSSLAYFFKVKRFGGRPVMGFFAEGVSQIDELFLVQRVHRSRPQNQRERQDEQRSHKSSSNSYLNLTTGRA